MDRLAITAVGQISITARGVEPTGWAFAFAGDGRVPISFEDGRMAGWSLSELHEIAHGVPCIAATHGCPLATQPG